MLKTLILREGCVIDFCENYESIDPIYIQLAEFHSKQSNLFYVLKSNKLEWNALAKVIPGTKTITINQKVADM